MTIAPEIHARSEAPGEAAAEPDVEQLARETPESEESGGTPLAQQRAAAILEVLAGVRGATEAATALGISVNHYYLLEQRALRGLVRACEAQPKGPRGPGLQQQVAVLQRELDACRQECLRQAALVRITQRAVGLPAVAEPVSAPRKGRKAKGVESPVAAGGRRRRRPTVRALRAARALRGAERPYEKNSSGLRTREGLQPKANPSADGVADQAADQQEQRS